jgi:hypothetical protein
VDIRHFIAAVSISPLRYEGELWLVMYPAVGRDRNFTRRLGVEGIGNPGFKVVDDDAGRLHVELACGRCPHYDPRYEYRRLAAELAVSALQGHAEHRLTA